MLDVVDIVDGIAGDVIRAVYGRAASGRTARWQCTGWTWSTRRYFQRGCWWDRRAGWRFGRSGGRDACWGRGFHCSAGWDKGWSRSAATLGAPYACIRDIPTRVAALETGICKHISAAGRSKECVINPDSVASRVGVLDDVGQLVMAGSVKRWCLAQSPGCAAAAFDRSQVRVVPDSCLDVELDRAIAKQPQLSDVGAVGRDRG